jgi:hypothetical protein
MALTKKALAARVTRALIRRGNRFGIVRAGPKDDGRIYPVQRGDKVLLAADGTADIEDERGNIVHRRVDLEKLGREVGALKEGEELGL